jgi:hypothetical protein
MVGVMVETKVEAVGGQGGMRAKAVMRRLRQIGPGMPGRAAGVVLVELIVVIMQGRVAAVLGY